MTKRHSHIDRISAEYAAGFFDGEGWVGIEHRAGWWRVSVSIGQLDPRPLQMMKDRWGGAIAQRDRGESATFHVWRISTKQAQGFLEDITPFVIVKQNNPIEAVAPFLLMKLY